MYILWCMKCCVHRQYTFLGANYKQLWIFCPPEQAWYTQSSTPTSTPTPTIVHKWQVKRPMFTCLVINFPLKSFILAEKIENKQKHLLYSSCWNTRDAPWYRPHQKWITMWQVIFRSGLCTINLASQNLVVIGAIATFCIVFGEITTINSFFTLNEDDNGNRTRWV